MTLGHGIETTGKVRCVVFRKSRTSYGVSLIVLIDTPSRKHRAVDIAPKTLICKAKHANNV